MKASPSTVKRLSSSPSAANRSSCQTMPKAARSSSPELGVSGEEAGLVERLGEPPPEDALALLRFELLPDGGLILARGGGDRAKLLLSWHVARADLIEDGGMDSREQTQLTDLADRNGEADAMASSVQFSEARLSMERQRSTVAIGARDDVFAHRPHLVALVGVFDQDVDLGEADLYGECGPAGRRRRCVSSPLFSVAAGGCRMPTALMLARARRRTVRRAGFCAGCGRSL